MDINFVSKWLSFLFFSFSTLVFIFLFLKHTLLRSPLENSNSGPDLKSLNYLVGLAYLVTSIQMIVGLYYVLKLNPPMAAAHVGFSGLSMIGFSLVSYYTQRELKSFMWSFAPPLLGFFFLSFHIMAGLGVL